MKPENLPRSAMLLVNQGFDNDVCLECPLEMTTSGTGSGPKECGCPAGAFLGDGGCASCPTGADCSVVGTTKHTLVVLPGYWRPNLNSTQILQCYVEAACVGSNSSELCRVGHAGPLCNTCREGYKLDKFFLCTPITTTGTISAESIFLLLGTVAAFCISSVAAWRFSKVSTRRLKAIRGMKTSLKILFIAQQMNGEGGGGFLSPLFNSERFSSFRAKIFRFFQFRCFPESLLRAGRSFASISVRNRFLWALRCPDSPAHHFGGVLLHRRYN